MYKGRLTSQAGVTFIEALLQLLLFIVFCQLVGLIFLAVYDVSRMKEQRMEVDWEVAIADINYYLMDARVQLSSDQKTVFLSYPKEQQISRISFVNHALIYRKNAGVETIVAGMQDAKFSLEGQDLKLEAVLESSEKRQRVFIVEQVLE